jgi:hypothetical protein
MNLMGWLGLLLLFTCLPPAGAREVRAGVSRIDITPTQPIWLSGYANRNKPSEGIVHKLWAKALAIEDGSRGRIVIVTTDIIGLPRPVSDAVAARVGKQYGLDRARLLLNSSHTHAGPVVRPNLATMYALNEQQQGVLDDYARKLTDGLVNVIGAAIGDLAPARISIGHGKAGFAINRRQPTHQGVRLGLNPGGPVDHDVPVIAVHGADGKLRAALFGYACHNTTLGGDYYQITGDYAGFAQYELESMRPGVTALFVLLCGGDQNPNPRGTLEHAAAHGKTLAAEVDRVLTAGTTPLTLDLRAAFLVTQLAFAPHSREQYEEERKSTNVFRARRAEQMLKAYDARVAVRSVLYPVQAIRFSPSVAILALGGEVVVDYALRAKKEYQGLDLIVAGYSNDVMCYIPSRRVLKEGGYEAVDSMVYYGQPGPFTEEVEETVFDAIHTALGRVGWKRKK